MLFEIQHAITRPGQSLTIPPVSEKIKFGSMPDLHGPVPTHDEAEPMDIDSETPHVLDEEEYDDEEDDITIDELMWDIHNDITLADLVKQIIHEESRLKKEKEEEEGPFEFVDETTFWMRSREHLPSF